MSLSSSTVMRRGGEQDLSRRNFHDEALIGSAVVGVTEEVISFVTRDIAMNPESWLDFPVPDDDFEDFIMSDVQKEHALAIQRLAPRLAALQVELCPEHMTEGCFWKIYFVLLHSRLSLHDAELLSTPQMEERRTDTEVILETTEQHQLVNSFKGGEGKRLWKKVKYQLVEYHSLPGYLRDNEYILRHYRSEWPLKQALLSIFSIHNETLNVWTHLIGFFLFLSLTIYTAMKVPDVVHLHSLQLPEVLKADLHKLHNCLPSLPSMPDIQKLREELKTQFPSIDLLPSLSGWHIMDLLYNCSPGRFSNVNHTDVSVLHNMKEDVTNLIAPMTVSPITRWPFFVYLGGAMFCLLGSSTCHLLSCHSQRMSYIMLRIDYTGIAALIATSFYPPVYYSFMCEPFFCNLYLGCITLLGIATMLVSLLLMFQSPQYRSIRAILFSGMGLSGILPILHKQILFWNQPEALYTTGCEVLMGVLYLVGAYIYAARIPERWMPGKFDIAGHSHQIFHVFVVAAAYTHYRAGLIYLRWRDLKGC